ncbi:ScbR family autoregulator-binding transcription factor [Kitasatospora sp. NPDC058218]|uniref:ScbR family autoregulator-binding transcription factor n=1 Tax=Kitasatospora sp. NPDC058218 TaxID=3346385 RepID=UPI0036DE7682
MVGRPVKQERAERTRAALIQAAAKLFGEQGFSGTSVVKIADEAGLTLGAVYFHFRNKSELAREIVFRQPEWVVTPRPSEGLQRVVDVSLTWACQLLDNPILQAGARLVWEQEQFNSPDENSHRQWAEILLEDLVVAQRRRELRAGTDIQALARLVVYACTGAQMHSFIETRRADLPERVVEFWQLLLPAVATPSTARRIELSECRGRPE